MPEYAKVTFKDAFDTYSFFPRHFSVRLTIPVY